MAEICKLFRMNVFGCAVVGGVIGAVVGGMHGVCSLVGIVFLDVVRTKICLPNKPYIFDPDLVPQRLLLKTVAIGVVIGTLVGTVCAVVFNRLFPENRESN